MVIGEPGDDRDGSSRTTFDQYLRMDEREKDAEIQKAIDRLQKRIQGILYMLETDKQSITGQNKTKNDKP